MCRISRRTRAITGLQVGLAAALILSSLAACHRGAAAGAADLSGVAQDAGDVDLAGGDGPPVDLAGWTGGTVRCWGSNLSGGLGDNMPSNSTVFSAVPVAVLGLPLGVSAISSNHGTDGACALAQGGVYCWGSPGVGTVYQTAAAVAGLDANVTTISVFDTGVCAIQGGAVECVGTNFSGEVGAPASGSVVTAPNPVPGLTSGASALAGGGHYVCALVNGMAECWGTDNQGELAAPALSQSCSGGYRCTDTPVVAQGLPGPISTLATGSGTTCAIVAGGVWCWGSNDTAQLGANTMAARSEVPVQIKGLESGVTQLAVGRYNGCAVQDGSLLCWGDNTHGQLGTGAAVTVSALPVVTKQGAIISSISVGNMHVCALFDGGAWCWGNNGDGVLGNNSTAPSSDVPVPVQGLSTGVLSIVAANATTCALLR